MSSKTTPAAVAALKGRRPIAALTAYDYPTARLLDECGVDVLLVGDSLGMVVLGHPDTTSVTLDDVVHHTRAVARAHPRALVGADLPIHAYDTPAAAATNARILVAAGAEFVKAEGGAEILPQIHAIRAEGIAFCGHLGMLPQRVREEGGKYRIKGRDDAGRRRLLDDAAALETAGAFACVLELVTPPVAAELTLAARAMATIGIGSGPDCDGQILVTTDLVGSFPWFTPRFVTPLANVAAEVRRAVDGWRTGLGRPGNRDPATHT